MNLYKKSIYELNLSLNYGIKHKYKLDMIYLLKIIRIQFLNLLIPFFN